MMFIFFLFNKIIFFLIKGAWFSRQLGRRSGQRDLGQDEPHPEQLSAKPRSCTEQPSEDGVRYQARDPRQLPRCRINLAHLSTILTKNTEAKITIVKP